MLKPVTDFPIDPQDIEGIVTEDDMPVDNLFSEKQQRLLTEPLYSTWSGPGEGRPFLAAANLGVFAETRLPAIVPDMFISLDVHIPEDMWAKLHRSYFIQKYRKPPDLVVEIVSNKEGGENAEKRQKYAWMRVPYYVIHDPELQIMPTALTAFRLVGVWYMEMDRAWFPELKLGLRLWEGEFEDQTVCWLRWTDAEGGLIPTGKEAARSERTRAEQERARATLADQRAESAQSLALRERQRAEEATLRAERLADLLRQAGIEP